MRFGVLLAGDGIAHWRGHLPAIEDGGFWGLGMGDSQAIYPDPYVQSTVAALETTGLRVGPWVSNPVTRHPAVVARSLHSIDVLSGGRALLGLGTGDSAVRNAGRSPAGLTALEAYVRAVKGLLRDGHSDWQGGRVRFEAERRHIPVYVAGSGPRTLELAGRVADGAIIGSGLEQALVDRAKEAVEAGARTSGRTLDDLDLWWPAVANIADDPDTAISEIKHTLITYAHFGFRRMSAWKAVPAELVPSIEEVVRRYDPAHHARPGAEYHAGLADELGLTPFLRERFAVAGTVDEVAGRIAELGSRGVEGLWLSVRVPDKGRFLRKWTSELRPRVTGATS